MGASQEKRRRQDERAGGLDKFQQAQEAELTKKKRARIRNSVIAIAVALLIVVILFLNSNSFYTRLPSVTVGNRSYSIAYVNYLYYTNYHSLVQSGYAEYLGLDSSIPLKDQKYDETQSWHDYFKAGAVENLINITAMLNGADAEGYTLSQEALDKIAANLDSLQINFEQADNFSSINSYLVALYGRGMTRAKFEEILTAYTIAAEYASSKNDSFEFSDEEIEANYTEKKNDFDALRYRIFVARGTADEENGIDEETAKAEARERAENVAAATSEDEFAALCLKNADELDIAQYVDPAYSLNTRLPSATLSSIYSEWLLDPARKEGDTTLIDNELGFYVLYFIEREDNHYYTKNVRHILISGNLEAAEDSELTPEEIREDVMEHIKTQSDSIYEEWKAGDATEDSFATLANQTSMDSGSNTNGGLYEDVSKWQMVPEFNDFIFDPARKPGDTGIVFGESSNYFGYHIMYYSGESDEYYSTTLSRTALQTDAYAAWQDAENAKYEAKTKFPLMFAGQ